MAKTVFELNGGGFKAVVVLVVAMDPLLNYPMDDRRFSECGRLLFSLRNIDENADGDDSASVAKTMFVLNGGRSAAVEKDDGVLLVFTVEPAIPGKDTTKKREKRNENEECKSLVVLCAMRMRLIASLAILCVMPLGYPGTVLRKQETEQDLYKTA